MTTTSTPSIPDFHYNPMTPEMNEDPSAIYAALREQPIFHWPMAGFYIVARFADVMAALRNPDLTTDPVAAGHPPPEAMLPDELRRPIEHSLTRLPPEAHARVRRAVAPSFTPRAIERLRPKIQAIVDDALARFVVGGVLDVPRFAGHIPLRAIATLLDIPAEHDDTFRQFGEALVRLHDPRMTPELLAAIAPPALAGVALIRDLIARRREHLGDDLLSTLIRAKDAGDALSDDEMVGLVAMLINGGMLTTYHFLTFSLKSLVCVPERLAAVLADRSILPNALDEVLRHDSFGKSGTLRYVARDTVVAGAELPRGARVLVFFPAAYRDPAAFPDADRFDPARKPDDNLNYGHGAHFCTGAALARLEGEITIGTLLDRFTDFKIAGEPVWAPNPLVRELAKLDVALTPR